MRYLVMGAAPVCGFYGYADNGYPYIWIDGSSSWELYQEPEELVDHWPAIYLPAPNQHTYRVSESVYSSIEDASREWVTYFVRLATEYPPIKLPKRKDKK